MVVATEENYTIAGFTGIVDSDAPEFLTDSQLHTARNVLIYGDGSVRKRYPIQQFTSLVAGAGPLPAIIFIGQLVITSGISGTVHSLFHDAPSNRTYYSTGASESLSEIAGLTGQIVWSTAQYDGKVYVACENRVYAWDPVNGAVINSSSPPSIRKILAFRDRLFGISGDTLYWTEPGEPLNWAPENILYVNKGDGEQLTGAQIYNNSLILTKYSSFWILHFADDPQFWILNNLHARIGCTGPKALKLAHNLLYFMNREGMWVTDTVTFTRLHYLEEEFNAFARPITFDLFVDSVSIYKEWIIYSSRTYGTRVYRREQPYGFTEWNFGDTLWSDITEQRLFFPDNGRWLLSVGPRLYSFVPYGTATSSPVEMDLQTKYYDLDKISRTKRIKYATIVTKGNYNQANALYEWYTDNLAKPGVPLVEQITTTTTSSLKIQGPGFGRVHSLRIYENSNQEFCLFALNFVSQLHRQQMNERQAI